MAEDLDVSLKLWVVMNRALRSIEDRLRRQVEAHGLSLSEFAVLEVLLHKGALPIGEIGDKILLTSGSMTYVLDKLQGRDLIARRPSDQDRRILYAELTTKGRTLIKGVFAEHAALIGDLMAGLSLDEQRKATDLLRRLGLFAQRLPAPDKAA